ncbi:MAG: hypothetical protein HOK57_10945 [Planctomycetaceae bacterium]|nr:hypothetical protein [Planctomycetaceae bacterium]
MLATYKSNYHRAEEIDEWYRSINLGDIQLFEHRTDGSANIVVIGVTMSE